MNPKESPFSGMDPFLEKPARWSSVYVRLIAEISNLLSALVAPNFYVDIEQRVYITKPGDDPVKQGIVPDVYIAQPPKEIWYLNLRDKLPTVAVPLTPKFADVPLNLQTAFENMFARAYYGRTAYYEEKVPLPRLSPADGRWVQEQIEAWRETEVE